MDDVMRRVAEEEAWTNARKAHAGSPAQPFEFEPGATIDLAAPCVVVGGRNGSGKSRLLRAIHRDFESSSLLLNVHQLVEQAMSVLRTRDDLAEMADEFGPLGPDLERADDVKRVVGRDYEKIEWFGLEIEPDDNLVADQFRWSGDQPLFPYFLVQYRAREYSSLEMGLGEYSVHLLFWILEQHRHREDLTILLDEPDAYLPPVGASSLLHRLVSVAIKRKWRIVMTTHSEETIRHAIREDAFVLLRVDHDGAVIAERADGDPTVATSVLSPESVRHVIFCEDESAAALTNSILKVCGAGLNRSTTVVWGNGHGFLRSLHEHLPRPPKPDVRFSYVFDGDQRAGIPGDKRGRWRAICLPTERDPDALFRSVGDSRSALADRLGSPIEDLSRVLDTLEGLDSHDWVNVLGEHYGRPLVLWALSTLWVEAHREATEAWVADLRRAFA
ncbi:hypothetical protein [Cellulosimicrobium sp. NPDC057127]|uniref:hypothetical protein n=1 Tax=Cellulosimicrobium sp. NPDC057127 TaxID=3346026 RepID=UPI00362E50BB